MLARPGTCRVAPSGPGRSGRGGAYGGETPRESVDRGSRLGLVPRHQPAKKQTAGEPPGQKVKMRLDAKGRWVPVEDPRETVETTEAAERPPTGNDPRPAAFRN